MCDTLLGHLSLEPSVRESLLKMKSATIDWLLAPILKRSVGIGWRCHLPPAPTAPREGECIAHIWPPAYWRLQGLRNHSDPGWLELDPVAHCGDRMEGS